LHNIPEKNAILLFNGVLSYQPNTDALMAILDSINPILLQTNLLYTIVICGKELPEALQQLQAYTTKNIVYAGFVKDVEQYFKAADLFLNPVITGGGVKTKLIEAIGYNATVVSTQNGAIGCNAMVCLNKLIIVPNGNWSAFAAEIISAIAVQSDTPQAFYDTYYWGNIAESVLLHLPQA
jgi:glycosyltransferase involved in cell wall biosynthesis